MLCVLLVAAAVWSGSAAGYYACDDTPTRPRTTQSPGAGAPRCTARNLARRNADPLSFAFVIGLTLAVLLIPAAALTRSRPDEDVRDGQGE